MSMLYDLMNEINTKVDRLINDEFHERYVFETEDKEEILDRVALWLAQLV